MHARYQARLRRHGQWWAIDVPQLAVFTQCRTLDEAEYAARQAIAPALGIPRDAFAVDLVFPEFTPVLRPVVEARRRCAAAVAEEQQALADAIRVLVEEVGVNQLDACRILGVSQESLSQLSTVRSPAHSGHGRPTAGSSGFVPHAPVLRDPVRRD